MMPVLVLFGTGSIANLSSKPVYGLIFLFRWRQDDDGKQEAACPDGVWFANQVRPLYFRQWFLCSSWIDRQ